eukprot:scaffold7963_cov116-Isochrysis_galbana.AAC.26
MRAGLGECKREGVMYPSDFDLPPPPPPPPPRVYFPFDPTPPSAAGPSSSALGAARQRRTYREGSATQSSESLPHDGRTFPFIS